MGSAKEKKKIVEDKKGVTGGEVRTEVFNRVVREGGFNEKMTWGRGKTFSLSHRVTCSEGPHTWFDTLPHCLENLNKFLTRTPTFSFYIGPAY